MRQRTQAIAALRGHLAEYGLAKPPGVAQLPKLEAAMGQADPSLPAAVTGIERELPSHVRGLQERIDALSARVKAEACRDDTARRLMTVPGVGPVWALALAALAQPAESFSPGRDFAAWIGLVPWQNSSGGKASQGWGGP